MINVAQLQFLKKFGYLHVADFLPARELEGIHSEAARELSIARSVATTNTGWYLAPMDSVGTPSHAALLDHPWLLELTSAFLEAPTMGVRVEASERSGNLPWHVDAGSASSIVSGVNVILYFDPLTAENGALRVIPGSHTGPLGDAVRRFFGSALNVSCTQNASSTPKLSRAETWLPHVTIETKPGDAVVFSMSLWHASFNGPAGRRLSTVCFWKIPRTNVERSLLRCEFGRIRSHISKNFGYPEGQPIRARSIGVQRGSNTSKRDAELRDLGWF